VDIRRRANDEAKEHTARISVVRGEIDRLTDAIA
jgi:hypothetical protein